MTGGAAPVPSVMHGSTSMPGRLKRELARSDGRPWSHWRRVRATALLEEEGGGRREVGEWEVVSWAPLLPEGGGAIELGVQAPASDLVVAVYRGKCYDGSAPAAFLEEGQRRWLRDAVKRGFGLYLRSLVGEQALPIHPSMPTAA